MNEVRSAHLGHATSTAGVLGFVLCTCPPGHTIIVKEFHAWNGQTVNNTLLWTTRPAPPNQVDLPLHNNNTHAPSTIDRWDGWVVLEEGMQLVVFVGQPNISVWASGTLLIGVASLGLLFSTQALPAGTQPTIP